MIVIFMRIMKTNIITIVDQHLSSTDKYVDYAIPFAVAGFEMGFSDKNR